MRGAVHRGRARGARGRSRPAFTLIEVLIGILILALALLGLGAVVPVVVRVQRQASDATQGTVVSAGAAAYLASRADLNRLGTSVGTQGLVPYGWGVWLLDPNWSPTAGAQAYLWEPLTTGELDPATGRVRLQRSPAPPVVVHVADRLWPARDSGAGDPVFVWDLIARRVPVGADEPERIQVGVFVRRIDLNIRVPSGMGGGRPYTLYDVLTGAVPAGAARLPVAVDSNGFPTNSGVGEYARVRTVPVVYYPNRPDRLLLSGGTPTDRALARQPGQRLLDNLGNVYTVRAVDEGDPSRNTVLIEPGVPGWVPDPAGAPVQARLRQVAFTPQVPAAVSVLTFTPMDP